MPLSSSSYPSPLVLALNINVILGKSMDIRDIDLVRLYYCICGCGYIRNPELRNNRARNATFNPLSRDAEDLRSRGKAGESEYNFENVGGYNMHSSGEYADQDSSGSDFDDDYFDYSSRPEDLDEQFVAQVEALARMDRGTPAAGTRESYVIPDDGPSRFTVNIQALGKKQSFSIENLYAGNEMIISSITPRIPYSARETQGRREK